MKTKSSSLKKEMTIIFMIGILLFGFKIVNAQQWSHLAKMNTNASIIATYDLGNYHYFGLGIDNPNVPKAVFHIKLPITVNFPCFQVEATNTSGFNGKVKTWFDSTGTHYGVYESSQTESVLNYFQDPVRFNNMTITGTQTNNTSFITGYGNGLINFIMGPTVAGDTIIPLSIRRNGIRVRTNIVTDSFQLLTNPGLNKILVSDANGKGNWTDASLIGDNKWLYNKDSDIYANPLRQHVGIGFQSSNEKIYQMLSILNGNILLTHSTSNIKGPSSRNGSVLFGDTVSAKNTLGEWGIEYENDTAYASSGLNFWKPYSCGNPGNKFLYLRNDGNIGIGTNNTFGYKLGVAGSIICTELKVRKFVDWPDYVLKDDYKLRPLNELAEYINEHQRLPEMPSAKEVSENGVNVGDMDVTLVKKIEELTKYLLEQQKQLLDQQKQINELKQELGNK